MIRAVAHRGDPVGFRENTLEAFHSAVQLGADMIELDVQVTRDGHAVILHDDTLERLWGIPRRISEMTYEEIQRATEGPYRVPLLDDVLREISLPIMADVKYADCVESMVATIRARDAVDRTLVVGGNVEAHRKVREMLATIELGLTQDTAVTPSYEILAALKFSYWNPAWWLLAQGQPGISLGPQLVGDMKDRGYKVSTWTVDATEVMHMIQQLGVDLIISNQVSELCTVLRW